MRVGSMLRQLLEELHQAEFDENSRDRLRDIYETSVVELGSALSPDLRNELDRITLPFSDDEIPSEAELRVAEAQLVGLARRAHPGHPGDAVRAADGGPAAAREHARPARPGGAPGRRGPPGPGGPPGPDNPELRPGTYL